MSNSAQTPIAADEASNGDVAMTSPEKLEKGKGKAPQTDMMEEDDDENESEEEGEGDPEDPDEDNMEEIDLDNIVSSRTRGKNIDYAEAAKQLGDDDDEDDEDDEDFEDEEMEG